MTEHERNSILKRCLWGVSAVAGLAVAIIAWQNMIVSDALGTGELQATTQSNKQRLDRIQPMVEGHEAMVPVIMDELKKIDSKLDEIRERVSNDNQ